MSVKRYIWTLAFTTLVSSVALIPLQAFAYGESSYYSQGTYYSQGYYQGYYQAYYQGYYQSYYQAYYQAGYYAEASYRLTLTKPVTVLASTTVTGAVSKGGGSFVIDDPLDPFNKLLFHSFVESPDAKNLYDGTAVIDANGEAVVQLPAYFELLNQDFRYQLKPIDRPMPNLYVKAEEKNNQFTIGGGVPGGTVSWQITGTRHDAYILANPIQVEVNKGGDSLVPIGEYVYPEGYAGQPHWISIAALALVFLALVRYVAGPRLLSLIKFRRRP